MHNRETDKQRALHTSLRIHHGSRPPCVQGGKQNGHDAELTERGMMDDAAETRPGGCWAGDAHHRGSPRGGPAGAAPARKALGPPHDGPSSQAPSPQVCSTKPPALERRRGRARAAVFCPPSWTLQPQAPPDARHSGCPGGFTARCLFPERRPSPPFCPEAPALAIALGSAGPVCSKPAGVTHCVHCPLCFLTPHCRAPGEGPAERGAESETTRVCRVCVVRARLSRAAYVVKPTRGRAHGLSSVLGSGACPPVVQLAPRPCQGVLTADPMHPAWSRRSLPRSWLTAGRPGPPAPERPARSSVGRPPGRWWESACTRLNPEAPPSQLHFWIRVWAPGGRWDPS